MPEGPPAAWIVTVLGLWVLASPFVLSASGTYQIVLIISGLVVAALGAYRGLQPDEKVPVPALPIVVNVFGIITIGSPFLFGNGLSDILGISLIIAGVVFIVIPAIMINQKINEQHAAST